MSVWLARVKDGDDYVGLFVAPKEDDLFEAIDEFCDPNGVEIKPFRFGGILFDKRVNPDGDDFGYVAECSGISELIQGALDDGAGWKDPAWTERARNRFRASAKKLAENWHSVAFSLPMPARSLAERCTASTSEEVAILTIDESFVPMASPGARKRLVDELYRHDANLLLNFADEVPA